MAPRGFLTFQTGLAVIPKIFGRSFEGVCA